MTGPILVDTHILLWVRTAPDRLSPAERERLVASPRRFVSAVTLWEIAMLQGLGRVERDGRLLSLPEGFDLLPIEPSHCAVYAGLPRLHRDPFDRMLVAQAKGDGLALLTRDAQVAAYAEAGLMLAVSA